MPVWISMFTCGDLVEFGGDLLDVVVGPVLGVVVDVRVVDLLEDRFIGRVELWAVGDPDVALFSHQIPKNVLWYKYAF